jgi:hypothetical protein
MPTEAGKGEGSLAFLDDTGMSMPNPNFMLVFVDSPVASAAFHGTLFGRTFVVPAA